MSNLVDFVINVFTFKVLGATLLRYHLINVMYPSSFNTGIHFKIYLKISKKALVKWNKLKTSRMCEPMKESERKT